MLKYTRIPEISSILPDKDMGPFLFHMKSSPVSGVFIILGVHLDAKIVLPIGNMTISDALKTTKMSAIELKVVFLKRIFSDWVLQVRRDCFMNPLLTWYINCFKLNDYKIFGKKIVQFLFRREVEASTQRCIAIFSLTAESRVFFTKADGKINAAGI